MSVQIGYDSDSRLTFAGLECDCPCEHHIPSQDIYVGQHLLERLPQYIARRSLGTHAVLVTDNNEYEVAGRRVEELLCAAGYDVILCRIVREGHMEPDERAVGEALLSMQPETEFFIAVGSGSITDTTRVTAYNTGRPFVSVGTAPSMDGYTSVVAPLTFRGAKIHRKGNCPEIIVCDLDILRTAPLDMFVSGVGDVLGKYIAKADWVIGSIINDEVYCPVCGGIVLDAVNKLLDNIGIIRARTVEGTRILIEALLLAGITIMIVGHTRAVASVEHNIAHYWEMRKLAMGEKPPAHGTSVGIATLMIWPAFERFAEQDLSGIDKDKLVREGITHEARERWMISSFGEEIGRTFMAENPEDFLTREEHLRRIERALAREAELKAELRRLPKYGAIRAALEQLGSPLTPGEIGISAAMNALSLRCAKDYRSRYTLFKLLSELGLLEDYLQSLQR